MSWDLTLRAYSRNLGKCSILARKGTFYEKRALFLKKGTKNSTPPPHSIPFLRVLNQNKALYNFCKRGQRSMVERNIGLEYALTL